MQKSFFSHFIKLFRLSTKSWTAPGLKLEVISFKVYQMTNHEKAVKTYRNTKIGSFESTQRGLKDKYTHALKIYKINLHFPG